jgi:hypothetical protein
MCGVQGYLYTCLSGFSTSKLPKISCKLNWVQAIKNGTTGRRVVKMTHSERVGALKKLAPETLTVCLSRNPCHASPKFKLEWTHLYTIEKMF